MIQKSPLFKLSSDKVALVYLLQSRIQRTTKYVYSYVLKGQNQLHNYTRKKLEYKYGIRLEIFKIEL